MNREYHKWFSPRLRKEMELLIFGHAVNPCVIFSHQDSPVLRL